MNVNKKIEISWGGEYTCIQKATETDFNEKGYLDYNTDVKNAYSDSMMEKPGWEHFQKYGKHEGRSQFDYRECDAARRVKRPVLEKILDFSKCHEFMDGTYCFLPQELRGNARVQNYDGASCKDYAYEGLETDASRLILDCGSGLRRTCYGNVINLEIFNYPTTDVLAVGEDLPFKNEVFDAVFSAAVLEHVKDPFQCVREIRRVLKPGGMVYCQAVFMQPYHGYPDHYFNFTPNGARLLFDGFEIVSQTIPDFMHPIYSLQWICREWVAGLEQRDSRESFLAMSIGNLLQAEPEELLAQYACIKGISDGAKQKIAAGTYILAKK